MKRAVICILNGLVISVFACVEMWAQATAQISGVAKDQSGALLPGVEVSATQTETGISRTAVTNETGFYLLSNLALGPYRLQASLPGFRSVAQTGIVLQVNSSPSINLSLEVGPVSEQIEVQANAALVETRNVGVGQVIENQRILELPLNGRNVNDLITLAGAAVQTATVVGRQSAGNVPLISVGGGMSFGAEYRLDGASHENWIVGTSMPMPFPDALQEFKVETSGLSAQNSQLAAVGAVTKSGTNELHGNLFEFVRNDLFNARNYFAAKNSTLKRNQFGGTLGGAIVKNKLFFFGGYQGTTVRQDPADRQAFVPTPAMLAGDWTDFTSAACNTGRQIALRSPFADNRINPSQYSKAALNIVSRLLAQSPKPVNPCGLVIYGRPNRENDWQITGRIDYQRSAGHSVFGRFLTSGVDVPNPFDLTPDNLLNTPATGNDNIAHSYSFGDTYLIGSGSVNAFRLAFNRVYPITTGNEFFSACDVGINVDCSSHAKRLLMNITGGFQLGAPRSLHNDNYTSTSYEIDDDLSFARGAHQMAFGGRLAFGRYDVYAEYLSAANFTFNGQATGMGMADFMLGRPSQLEQGSTTRHRAMQWVAGLYAADAWRVTPRLTLNYGVRWEPYLPQWFPNNRNYNFSYEKFLQGVKSTIYKNAPAGFTYPGDPGFPGKAGAEKQWAHFAPRLGIAWDVNGDGRTSVRASYALTYHYYPLEWRIDAGRAYPWGAQIRLPSPPGGLENPWQGATGGNPFPVKLDPNAPFGPFGAYQTNPGYNPPWPYASSWNLSVQRQIGPDWLVSASYIGSETIHVWAQAPLNPAVFLGLGPCTLNGVNYASCSTTTNTNQRRKLSLEKPQEGQFLGEFGIADPGGTQSYSGLLFSVQRRAARGITVNGNYTWSHCISDYADTNGGGPDSAEVYTHPDNRRADRGDCQGDRRQIFNVTSVFETPQFGNAKLRILAAGWRLSGIYRVSSGSPLTVTTGTDRALNGIANQHANQVLADVYGDRSGRPMTNYLNAAAFAQPDLGTLGNLGRNNITGPKSWAFDMALSRIFQLGENQRLEVRAEGYNVTNSFRPGEFTASCSNGACAPLNSNTFGQIRTALDPRIMQFALKYLF